MADRDNMLRHAAQLLEVDAFSDGCPNGLQVLGRERAVTTVASAVSCTRHAFEAAASLGAQLLVVHHGLFWRSTPQVIDAVMRDRLATLFRAGITLAGYHLPLDAHPELGNNALLADLLGLDREAVPFARHGGRPIGIVGTLPAPTPLDTLVEQVQAAAEGRVPLVLGARRDEVRRLAVCTGGASGDVIEAAALGCDAFITGEPHESTHAHARELGIAFIAAGHHATERFGIRALGEHLAREFGTAHHFVDADNPV